jgi:hypothetical protein
MTAVFASKANTSRTDDIAAWGQLVCFGLFANQVMIQL